MGGWKQAFNVGLHAVAKAIDVDERGAIRLLMSWKLLVPKHASSQEACQEQLKRFTHSTSYAPERGLPGHAVLGYCEGKTFAVLETWGCRADCTRMIIWTEKKSPNPLEEGNEQNFETWMHAFSSLLSMYTSSFQFLSSLSLCNERIQKRRKKSLCYAEHQSNPWHKPERKLFQFMLVVFYS